MPALRSLQKTLNRAHEDLSVSCEGNVYLLSYLLASGEERERQAKLKGSLVDGGGGGGRGKRAAVEEEDQVLASKGSDKVAPKPKKKKVDR